MSTTPTIPTIQKGSKQRCKEARVELMTQFGVKNPLAAPKIEKICVNMGVGRAVQDGQILNVVSEHMTRLAGQKAVITKARKAVSNFRSRQGMKIGCMVTLRGERMWSFLDRLIHVAIPRIKDFRGLAKAFDENGNYNVGFREQAIFPEIELERLEHNQGMQVTIVFSHSNPEKSLVMLRALGMPIKN